MQDLPHCHMHACRHAYTQYLETVRVGLSKCHPVFHGVVFVDSCEQPVLQAQGNTHEQHQQ